MPELIEAELEGSLSNDEASELLRSLQASRKSSGTSPSNPSELDGAHSILDPDDEEASLQPESQETPSGEYEESSTPDSDDDLTSTPTPAEKAKVSVSSSADPDAQRRKEEFKNQLQPKLGFFDRHKKESTVTAVGSVLVGVGALGTIIFPPVGFCIYACGILVLSMGLTELMASGDVPDSPPPTPKPDKPEPKPDESKSKPGENNADDGKFMAVRKPVLEALTQGDGAIPVREDGSLDEDEAKKRLRKLAQESGINADPEVLLEQMSTGIQAGLPLSEVIAEALADVLSRDKSIDPHDAEFKAVTNAILSAAEAMMDATSASEKEQALTEFLAKLKEMLPRMSDASLGQLMAMTRGALVSSGTEEARQILTSVLKLLEAEMAERSLKQQSSAAPGGSSKVPPQPSASEAVASEPVDLSISKNRVHYRVLSFELSTLKSADRLNGNDSNDFLNAAKEVLEKPRGESITGAQFLDELERYTGGRFTQIIEKMRDKKHFK
ncbi:hypothetical protein [Endozoicomonas sp. 4G]|uniref:hypothetical protein n=1 Tax=Endozoicomonas sp. 4G TaxID=2872754 RepID=UPI002078AF80|nr:hypothetical protein [Endozoicomonas sp. 4G]